MSTPSRPVTAWATLGRSAPTALVPARLPLHHAAQLVAAVGRTLLEPRPDDSHPNLGWLAQEGALAGHRIPGGRPFQAALYLAELRLLLLDGADRVRDSLPLAGGTLEAAREWLADAIVRRFDRTLPSGLTLPGYELPPHPVAEGAAFALEPAEAFAELARWFADADTVLGDLARRMDGASAVRCWPHHFDIATLVTVETGPHGDATKTIGVGLSPGDETYPEPYWYVSPWPHPPAASALPALPAGGLWHREGFTAAILTGTEVVARGPAGGQPERLREFLDAAVAACRHLHIS